MNEPKPGQRYELVASTEDITEHPQGSFALASDLDEALDLLAECEAELVNRGPVAEIRALLEKHGRKP